MSTTGWVGGLVLGILLALGGILTAQEASPAAPAKPEGGETSVEAAKEKAETLAKDTQEQIDKIAKEVDQSPQAKQISAGILQPIYDLAEHLAFPMFHWAAFAVMATGVVSYALQLVLGKLVVLSKMGFSPAEILSDALGLVISAVGLVLTTQAAAENSTFTQSPFHVLSASAVGLICGFIFYRWGQAQEVQAAIARRRGTTT